MISMFENCYELKKLDLCYFDFINGVKTDKMLDHIFIEKIKINKIYHDLFERILKSYDIDKILSVDLTLETKLDEILSWKAPNSLLDVISDKFSKNIKEIKEEIKTHLIEFELTEEYMKEILINFSSKTKIIFDLNKDKDSIKFIMSKIYRKSKIGCFVNFRYLKSSDNGLLCSYLNGKFEFVKNIFSFQNNDLFTYEAALFDKSYYGFISYKPQNSKFIYQLINNDLVYIILIIHDKIRAIFKIKDNFYKNPIEFLDFHSYIPDIPGVEDYTPNFFEKNIHNIKKIFEELYKDSNKKYFLLNELIIYQIEN